MNMCSKTVFNITFPGVPVTLTLLGRAIEQGPEFALWSNRPDASWGVVRVAATFHGATPHAAGLLF